ncbi:MAG: YqgE/AlgH family protein [Ignavibacteriae bacterium]|nr:YqgE/AlgH family protein [Ignavibacteriota bacterium]
MDENTQKPEKGKFLISAPHLTDIFRRSVIYLVEHNESGSVGFVLNRPMKYNIDEVIEDFPEFQSKVFLGGPVQTELVNFIHKTPGKIEGGYEIHNGIYWGGNFDNLKVMADAKSINPADFKFFVGYAGWSPNQLEDELKENSWYVANANEDFIFSNEPERLWQNILKSMGGEYITISTFPEDPSVN